MDTISNETEKEEHEYPIKKSDGYVDHCAKGDLEDMEDVEQKLMKWGFTHHRLVSFFQRHP